MNNNDLEIEIKKLIRHNLYDKGFVCIVDILLQMNYLTKKDYEAWRFGRVDFLEKVCNINLNKLTLINKLIGKYSTEFNLTSSWTGYNQYGKGTKRRLRFSKSEDKMIEERYATHYIDNKRMIELKEKKASRQ